MKERLRRLGRALAYPALYLFCLAAFGYLTFPFSAVGSRLVAEFDKSQRAASRSPTKPPMQLELGELDGYWLSGLEVRGAKVIFPPAQKGARGGSLGRGPLAAPSTEKEGDDTKAEPSVITVDHAHGRLRLLPLLIGRVRIDFGAEVFGGEVNGTLPYGGGSGDVEVEIEGVKLGEVQPLRALIGLPILGDVSGQLQVTPVDGKFSKADGKLELRIERVIVGDGKAQLQGVALPAAQIGDLVLTGTAKDGVLKIEEISATGKDLELQGDGRIRIREPWLRSQADIYLRFRFSDGYRNKDDTTRSLLGAPNSKIPPAIEFDARIKRSKRDDGFYAWHVHGPLSDLQFDPQSSTQAKGSRSRPATTTPKTGSGRPISSPLGARAASRRPAGISSPSDHDRSASAGSEPPTPPPAEETPPAGPEPAAPEAPAEEAPAGPEQPEGPPPEGAEGEAPAE